MLKFLTKLFRKSDPIPTVTAPAPSSVHSGFGDGPPSGVTTVETAQLSLAAILTKFPDDLKTSIAQLPNEEVKVAMPVPMILKQLPGGSVKMSLASLHRQAPAGVFKPGKVEDKRMIDVPLAEIFKRVRPEVLRRRGDQRRYDLPEKGFNLFGDKENPYAISPTVPEEPPPAPAPEVPPAAETLFEAPPAAKAEAPNAGKIKPPKGLAASVSPAAKAKPAEAAAPTEAAPAGPKSDLPPLTLSIADLAAGWPEPFKSEAAAMNGATVALPTSDVTAGLAKGKVAFTWGQIREWSTPAPTAPSTAPETTELALPLRVVAPAFLKHSKREDTKKKSVSIDEEIPALFHGGDNVPKPKPPEPAPAPVVEEAPSPAPASEAVEAPAPAEVPVPVSETADPVVEQPQPVAAAVVATPEPAPAPIPETLGEMFGQPDKTHWSPGDIVAGLMKMPTIAGAVVALQEGLVVAHQLPEGMKGETFAAFLPQIFARLNQYSGEMTLGEVDDLVITTHGAHCQMFRVGQVFFAVLGKTGAALPWHALRLCAVELGK